MERRVLGQTGDELSVIGFGGIVVRDVTAGEADACVGRAIDRGINYFDVAPSYGNAEAMLGPALEPYRDQVFLACKTGERRAAGAETELHASLRTLRTDHFDLYQMHGVTKDEDVDQILGPGGALEAFVQARDEGLVRNIGFSAHSEAAARRLLEAFPFAGVLFPINRFCWHDGNFGPGLIGQAQKQGAGILALKSLAHRPWRDDEERVWGKCWYKPVTTLPEAIAALQFTLSQPVTAAVAPGHAELLWLACDAVDRLGKVVETGTGEPIFTT